MNDKRILAFLALALLVGGLLGAFVIAFLGGRELAVAFAVIADLLALLFGVLSYGERIGKIVTVVSGVLALTAMVTTAVLIPIRERQVADLREASKNKLIQIGESMRSQAAVIQNVSEPAVLIVAQHENRPDDETAEPTQAAAASAKPVPVNRDAPAKIPDAIQALTSSIVTVTRIDSATGLPDPNPNVQAGVVVDPRGYILTLLMGDDANRKKVNVRFTNQREYVAEVVDSDVSHGLTLLRVRTPQPIASVKLYGMHVPETNGEKIIAVPSSALKTQLEGRITGYHVDLGAGFPKNVFQTDIELPLGAGGSLAVSDQGQPIGIWCAARAGTPKASFVIGFSEALTLLNRATPVVEARVATAPNSGFVGDAELKNPDFGGTGPKGQDGNREQAILDIVGTWSRAESGTFSKLTIWPIENRERLFFVECAEGNGLLEWNQTSNNFGGVFAFNLLGDRCAQAYLVLGPKETNRFFVSPFEDQRKELLRNGFAKTQRELDQKLSSDVTRVEVPVEQKPMPTVAVLKTEFEPARIRELLRDKYRQQPYRFFSNDTYRSVIVLAPAEAQEDIEVLIHKLDVKEEANGQAAWPNIAQQAPAKQPEEEETDETKFFHLESSDATTTLDVVEKLFQGRIRRISADRRTNALIVVALPSVCREVEAVVLKLESTPSRQRPAEANQFSPALPDTPAAKQLVEQLGAQESAAAAEAGTIRQLQANGQAEQNRQAIAEHQRKLKNLLSTAFDLKLQLEELQVQELQSRLSRLERQIGQRKELREKIINRRAGELIEGDALRWDSTAPASTKLPGSAAGNTKKAAKPEVVAILRERLALLWDDLRNGNAKPSEGLRAINELAQAEPPEAHAQHVERLQALLELVRSLAASGNSSKAEVLEIEAAYEAARSADDKHVKAKPGVVSSASTTAPPPKADQIVIDLYGGSQVLPGLGKNPSYSKLVQRLNALKGVTVNIREAGKGDAIVMAIVRDPSQLCQREARQTQKESELRIAINSALKAAGIEAARWDENSDAGEKSADESAASNSSDERTFDGTPYSQWLKMLETERKPDKLATAMEACARLAATGDERRIARDIFVAAKLFEATDNVKERELVWNAGVAALSRLPGEVVVAELLAVLHDSEFKDAREFQSHFLAWVAYNGYSRKAATPESLKAALKSHADELIATFLKLARQSEDRNHRLLVGACSAWLISDRKLNEFDELRAQLMQTLEGLSSGSKLGWDPWTAYVHVLVDREPEMPGLALMLVKQCDHQPRLALHYLGRLGQHAEPAVPHLLKSFLKIWKEREDSLRAWAAGDERKEKEFTSLDLDDDSNAETRMVNVLKALGGIGPGAKAAAPLLQQIASLAPPTRGVRVVPVTDNFFDTVKQTLAKIGDVPATDPKQPPPIVFSDFLRLQATWKLSATKPNTNPKNAEFYFAAVIEIFGKRDGKRFLVNAEMLNFIGCRSSGLNYRIDETSSPKQIDLWSNDDDTSTMQLGIYELKGDRLKIELAKPGVPRPTEFSADSSKLPEGHVLLELDRDS